MKWSYRFLLLLIIVLVAYTVFSHGGLYDLWRLKKSRARAEAKNTGLIQQRNSFAEQIGLLKSDSFYIENIAREELGMAKNDEIIVYFKKESGLTPSVTTVIPEEK